MCGDAGNSTSSPAAAPQLQTVPMSKAAAARLQSATDQNGASSKSHEGIAAKAQAAADANAALGVDSGAPLLLAPAAQS